MTLITVGIYNPHSYYFINNTKNKKMKAVKRIMALSLSLLIVIMIEGLFTMGSAFMFESYTIIGWITQGLVVIFTITFTLVVVAGLEKEAKEKVKNIYL
jgi:predicted signal transduction protein with EAL and GGDEF domain